MGQALILVTDNSPQGRPTPTAQAPGSISSPLRAKDSRAGPQDTGGQIQTESHWGDTGKPIRNGRALFPLSDLKPWRATGTEGSIPISSHIFPRSEPSRSGPPAARTAGRSNQSPVEGLVQAELSGEIECLPPTLQYSHTPGPAFLFPR